jgi:hypothetical protein
VPEPEQHPGQPAGVLGDAGGGDERRVRARVGDHRAERVQVDVVPGERQPDTQEAAAGLDVVQRAVERAGEPAQLAHATHGGQIGPPEHRPDQRQLPHPAVPHREAQQRPGQQHGLRAQPVPGGRGLAFRGADPGQDLRVHGVVAQVVEQGLLVDPDQLVDQPPVRGVPEALAHPGGDRGDLVQHGRVDEGALVGAARGPAAAERG